MSLPTDFGYVMLDLTRPWMLWWLFALMPIVWYFWHSLTDFAVWQRRLSLGVRVLSLLALVLALAGLTSQSSVQKQFVIVAIDRSTSIDRSAEQQVASFIKRAQEHADTSQLAVLEFSSEPLSLQSAEEWLERQSKPIPTPPSDTAPSQSVIGNDEFDSSKKIEPSTVEVSKLGTNIAAAIEYASASMPTGYVPHIVLLSDGRETLGSAVQATVRSNISISTLPLPTRQEPEVQIANVSAPPQVRRGEPFYVEITVASNHDDEGVIDIYRGDLLESPDNQSIQINKGETTFRIRQTIEDEKQVRFLVRARSFQDTLLENNTASAVVWAAGKPNVLLIDSSMDQTNELRWALEEQDLSVQVRPIEGIPNSLEEIQQFDCVILSNVPATALSLQQLEIVQTYVRDLGGGLVVLGGDQSFGLGGYGKTALDELLPVASNFEKEKEKPSLAIVLVIDKSGSMTGEKIELAKEAAQGTADLLSPNDQLGVIAFDGAAYWISEVRSASDKGFIRDRISAIEAAGGTNIYPGLEEAYRALINTTAKIKHVILMTDGHSTPGDYPSILRNLTSARITLSSVAVSAEADRKLLEELAISGGGRYYYCDDPRHIPQIFAKETITASKSAMSEQPFLPQWIRPTQVLAGIDLDACPFLLGYVVTRAKPTSELILATENGEPLLAWWRYGLGMTVAFTSDAKSQWATEWLSWPQFGQFWSQITRHALRKSDTRGIFVEVEERDGNTKVVVDAVNESGQFVNATETKLTVIHPDLTKVHAELQQTAPGRYEAEFPTNQPGAYQLELTQSRGGTLVFQQSRTVVVGYPDELRLGPPQEDLLEQISSLSGGQFRAQPDRIFDSSSQSALRVTELWPYLLGLALALLPIDIALRRLDLDWLTRYHSRQSSFLPDQSTSSS